MRLMLDRLIARRNPEALHFKRLDQARLMEQLSETPPRERLAVAARRQLKATWNNIVAGAKYHLPSSAPEYKLNQEDARRRA